MATICTNDIKPGYEHTFSYPFTRDEFTEMDEDGESKRKTWRPGIRQQNTGPETVGAFADSIGQQIVTVVAVFKPGKYPERVFFTRKWRDPSGKVFGKNNLHMTTRSNFIALTRGYRHEFEMSA